MENSFFATDLFRFGSIWGSIIIISIVFILRLKERTPGKVSEAIAMVVFGITGFSSIISFIMHFFFSDMVAVMIGWGVGSPFQKEVAGANLAIGIIGYMCFWRRDFWLPYVISKTAFLWIAGITHVVDIMQHQNMAAGNAGITLYMDFFLPVFYIVLLWLTKKYGKEAPKGLMHRTPQLG